MKTYKLKIVNLDFDKLEQFLSGPAAPASYINRLFTCQKIDHALKLEKIGSSYELVTKSFPYIDIIDEDLKRRFADIDSLIVYYRDKVGIEFSLLDAYDENYNHTKETLKELMKNAIDNDDDHLFNCLKECKDKIDDHDGGLTPPAYHPLS